MHKFKLIFTLVVLCFAVAGCQTVKQKTDAIVEKENEKLSEVYRKICKQTSNGIRKT